MSKKTIEELGQLKIKMCNAIKDLAVCKIHSARLATSIIERRGKEMQLSKTMAEDIVSAIEEDALCELVETVSEIELLIKNELLAS